MVHRASLAPVGRMMASMLRALRLQELIVMEASEVLTLARVLGAPAGVCVCVRERETERRWHECWACLLVIRHFFLDPASCLMSHVYR